MAGLVLAIIAMLGIGGFPVVRTAPQHRAKSSLPMRR